MTYYVCARFSHQVSRFIGLNDKLTRRNVKCVLRHDDLRGCGRGGRLIMVGDWWHNDDIYNILQESIIHSMSYVTEKQGDCFFNDIQAELKKH